MNATDATSCSLRRGVERIAQAAGRLIRLTSEVVFPTTCPACGVSIPSHVDLLWCGTCAPRILEASGREYCALCGRNTGPYERRDGRCVECRSRRSPLEALVRVAPHVGPFRQMVLDFKFHQAPLDRTLGALMAAAVQGAPWSDWIDAVIPVPAHWRRRLERGHHPTRALAGAVGSDLRLPMVEALGRSRYDPPQVGMSAPQRRDSVRGAFKVIAGARLEGATVCLIDDVTTTGATLTEAARTLRRAGTASVYAAVVTKSDSISRV